MNGQQPDYRKILEDFVRQRDALEQVIAGLRVLAGESASTTNLSGGGTAGEIHADTFIGKTIVDAASMYLRMVGRPARSTEQIVEALNRGGLTVSKESVSAILMRDANQEGEMYKVGRGVWGLSEWYPGATKRAKKKISDKEGESEETKEESASAGSSKEESSDAA